MDEQLLACLAKISDVLDKSDAEDAETAGSIVIGAHELDLVRGCVPYLEEELCSEEDVGEFWKNLVQAGQVSFLQLTKVLGLALRDPQQAWACCAFYSTLLRLKGCPVSGLQALSGR